MSDHDNPIRNLFNFCFSLLTGFVSTVVSWNSQLEILVHCRMIGIWKRMSLLLMILLLLLILGGYGHGRQLLPQALQRQLETLGAQWAGLEDMLKEMKRKFMDSTYTGRSQKVFICFY